MQHPYGRGVAWPSAGFGRETNLTLAGPYRARAGDSAVQVAVLFRARGGDSGSRLLVQLPIIMMIGTLHQLSAAAWRISG